MILWGDKREIMLGWFVCPTVSMVITSKATGLEKDHYIICSNNPNCQYIKIFISFHIYIIHNDVHIYNSRHLYRVRTFQLKLQKVSMTKIYT